MCPAFLLTDDSREACFIGGLVHTSCTSQTVVATAWALSYLEPLTSTMYNMGQGDDCPYCHLCRKGARYTAAVRTSLGKGSAVAAGTRNPRLSTSWNLCTVANKQPPKSSSLASCFVLHMFWNLPSPSNMRRRDQEEEAEEDQGAEGTRFVFALASGDRQHPPKASPKQF